MEGPPALVKTPWGLEIALSTIRNQHGHSGGRVSSVPINHISSADTAYFSS